MIDRHALVTRHNVKLSNVDTLGSLSVGNGEFAFTVDVTGLQTFYKEYENGISLGTQAQWAWHSVPNKANYILDDVNVSFESCDGTSAPYPVQHKEGRKAEATNFLRANPHRLHLGIVGLNLTKSNGERVQLTDVKKIKQELDLWTGRISSYFEIDGESVHVTTYAHQEKEQISVSIDSKLITQKRLSLEIKFPYGKECHVCPGYDFDAGDKHQSIILKQDSKSAAIQRHLDSTIYHTTVSWNTGLFEDKGNHTFELIPQEDHFEFSVLFTQDSNALPDSYTFTRESSEESWDAFWNTGAAVDFSKCTDPRAAELERRVVLSQYLTRIQCAGSLPPQETGLTMNSWYGKFHLEMHWWHGAHFPLWGRPELLEKSMQWYIDRKEKAEATAVLQGYRGARWQKMTDPFGNESPSGVGAFIIWQQPHPIYLAELIYRSQPDDEVLECYRDIVFSSAEFMVSFLRKKVGKYHLCHPLIPAQEIFKATETDDPAFELQYWHYGLTLAQEWRSRLGMERDPSWQEVLDNMAPLPSATNLYLPTRTTPNAYTDDQFRNDHPAVLGVYGFLPYSPRVDTTVMLNTLNEIMNRWNWESAWGWDYPLVAMSATRLNQPEIAINALLMETQKNTYLVNGHNYQDTRLRLYLPGNGGLLSAIALMTAGWDGCKVSNPGFPKDGKWNVRWENMNQFP